MSYKIALTNVDFDNSYANTVRFNSVSEQIAYFNINTLFSNSPDLNVRFNNLLYVEFDFNCSELNINNNLNYNYAIIKDTTGEKTYYFYFIKKIYFNSNSQVHINAELDVIQTYYIDLSISPCLIERTHLDRFIEDTEDNTKVKFNSLVTSKLFQRENYNSLSKRLTKRTKVDINIDSAEDSDLNEWLKNNILCWVYIYISPSTDGYNVFTVDGTARKIYGQSSIYFSDNTFNFSSYRNPYGILCYPIYKSTSVIKYEKTILTNTYYNTLWSNGLQSFLSANGGESIVYQIKLSSIPPFKVDDYSVNDYYIDSTALYLKVDSVISSIDVWYEIGTINCGSNNALINVSRQYCVSNYYKSISYNISSQVFNKSAIIGSNKNKDYNPKLLSADFKDLRLTNGTSFFDYDIQKLGLENCEICLNEVFTPDITRQYARIKIDTNGIFITDTDKNFTGLTSCVDNSIPYSKNQLDIFLANNKNFFFQRQVNLASKIGMSLVTGTSQATLGFPGVGIASASNGIISSIADYYNSEKTLDNMKAAPEQLTNANGNALFFQSVTDIGIYIEEYSAIDTELEMANDFMNLYGYNYGRIDNIKSYDNIRKYFNFIKAQIEIVKCSYPISNEIRDKIKQIFSNGIRFWNVTQHMFEYTLENYERWLEVTNG